MQSVFENTVGGADHASKFQHQRERRNNTIDFLCCGYLYKVQARLTIIIPRRETAETICQQLFTKLEATMKSADSQAGTTTSTLNARLTI